MKFALCMNYKSELCKKKMKMLYVPFQNGGQIIFKKNYFTLFRFWPNLKKKKKKKKKKNTFPKEFFNEIWLKVGELE